MRRFLTCLSIITVLATACGSDAETVTGNSTPDTQTTGNTADEPSGDTDPATTGTVTLRLEEVTGFFTEGFEVGIRFEDASGNVLAAQLWSDYITALGDPTPDFYTSVVEQEVPAGNVTIHAETAIGAGPPPVAPDVDGELACSLEVSVEENQVVPVEISFSDTGCLTLIGG